jgi:hypothetical protein
MPNPIVGLASAVANTVAHPSTVSSPFNDFKSFGSHTPLIMAAIIMLERIAFGVGLIMPI